MSRPNPGINKYSIHLSARQHVTVKTAFIVGSIVNGVLSREQKCFLTMSFYDHSARKYSIGMGFLVNNKENVG